jgi:hypothetical protein
VETATETPGTAPVRHSGARAVVGVIVLALVASAAVYVWVFRGPSITVEQVQEMIRTRELVGLPIEEAARRLGHRADESDGDTVLLDFDNVRGWTGGSVLLEVEDGKVTMATWGPSVTGRSGEITSFPPITKPASK